MLSGIQKKFEDLSTSDIFGTPQLYSYFLRTEFAKIGIETESAPFSGVKEPGHVFRERLKLIPSGADHIVCLEQRAFYNRSQATFLVPEMKKLVPGKITTICDNNDITGQEDMLYYAVPAKQKPKSLWVGWGADPTICRPDKDNRKIRILIDHSYYGSNRSRDMSDNIINDAAKFSLSNKNIEIRRFISGGIENLDINNLWKDKYNRSGLSFTDACKEYCAAHIFIVTHPESMGLSVLEAAMSGALIVLPNGYIRHELIRDLNHIEYTGNIPWKVVLNRIDPDKSRKMALKHTWSEVAGRIASDLYK